MQAIRKFLGLSHSDQLFLMRVLLIVAITRVRLSLFPNRVSSQPVFIQGGVGDPSREELYQVGWAVRNAARLVPRASCLTQALAAQRILSRSKFRSEIKIGVVVDICGRLRAHAWLVSGGCIVVGGTPDQVGQFTELQRVGARPS